MWIDELYQLQGLFFGNGTRATTVVAKVLADQLIFTPFLHVPVIQLALLYIKCELSCGTFSAVVHRRKMLTPEGLLADWWFPALLPTWMIWCPTVSVIYSLPPSLQLIIFLIVIVFWSIIQIVVGSDTEDQDILPSMNGCDHASMGTELTVTPQASVVATGNKP
jgi:hypothetical protein